MTVGGEVDIVAVSHNSKMHLAALIESLWPDTTAADEAAGRLIIVDSGSTTPRDLLDLPCKALVAFANYGYGAAANVGLLRSTADWVALVNPDCRITYAAIKELVGIAVEVDVDIVAPSLKNERGESIEHFTELPRPPWKAKREYRVQLGRDIWGVASVRGAIMVMHRQRAIALGGFDDGFFLYGEEIDFCMRVRDHGGVVAYVSAIEGIHIGEASSGDIQGWWRRAQRTRGKARYMRKRYGRWACLTSLLADAFREYRLVGAGKDYRKFLRAVLADPRVGLSFPPTTLDL